MKLRRPVQIRVDRLNPYALTATVRGFAVKERDGARPFLGFEEPHLNFSSLALLRLAPVVSEVRLAAPGLRLLHNAEGSYNAADLIDELMEPSPGPRRNSR